MQRNQMWTATSITLLDALEFEPTLLEHFDFGNETRNTMFKKVFVGRYGTKSIAGETVQLFKTYIDTTFDEFVDYYNSVLDVYEKELNYDEGIKITRKHVDNGSGEDTSNSGSTDTYIDLPNRPTQNEYASNKTNRNGNASSSNSYEKEINETVTGGVNVVEQREKAIKFLRNIYLEFANKFEDCFACIYA